MIHTPTVSTEHHARLMPHVDDLEATAELIATASGAELRPRLDASCAFLTGLLIPHMEAAERAIYPELERLMQNRHSMTPMRNEHQLIRSLIAELDTRRQALGDGPIPTGTAITLRRVLYRLHGLLKVHLAEEQLYANIAEHGLSRDASDALAAAMAHEGTELR